MAGDARDIVYVKQGAHSPEKMLVVPSSTWTRDPETIGKGEYAYDTFASADFRIGGFPFYDFLFYVSGKSSYEMVPSIREFYRKLEAGEAGDAPVDREKVERELRLRILRNAIIAGVPDRVLSSLLEMDRHKVQYLKGLARAKYPEIEDLKKAEKEKKESTEKPSASNVVEC